MGKYHDDWRNYEPPAPENRGRVDGDGRADRSAQQDERQHAARLGRSARPGRRGARITSNTCYVDPSTRAILQPDVAAGLQKARAAAFANDAPLERFQSEKEAKRYVVLLGRLASGQIRELRRQVRFPLNVRRPDGIDQTIAHYVADFEYYEIAAARPGADDGADAERPGPGPRRGLRADSRVIEDTKGFRTEMYRRSKKHFEAQYGLTIAET